MPLCRGDDGGQMGGPSGEWDEAEMELIRDGLIRLIR